MTGNAIHQKGVASMDDAIIIKPPTIPKSRLWTALIAILLGQFVVAIDLTVLNIALPEMTREIGPTSDQLLWIVDVYSLVLAGLLIAMSSLSDRVGRKKMLLAGFLVFGIGSILVVFADTPEQVIAIRAFLGVGGAMIMPVTISMIRSIFIDSKERAVAVAAWAAVSSVGMAAGPLIGGFLLEHFSWHSAFLVNVPLVGVAFLLGVFALPEVRLKNPGKFDVLGSLLALAGMFSLLWGIKHLAAELEFDTSGIVAVIAGLLLMALFVFRCLKSKNPMVDMTLFQSKTFTAGIIATMACTFALAILLYMLAQWLQLVNGDSALESGIHLIPMSIATLISSVGAASLAMRYPARHVAAAGLGIAAVAMLMLFFFQDDLTLTVIIISTCLVGLGTGSLAVGAALIMAETPIDKASSAGSLQEISYDLGNVFGVAILGSFASIVYRTELGTSALRAMGLDSQIINEAKQSFAATADISHTFDLPQLFTRGVNAFNDSLVLTCIIGGFIILATAIIVWKLIPANLKITDDSEESPVKDKDRTTPHLPKDPTPLRASEGAPENKQREGESYYLEQSADVAAVCDLDGKMRAVSEHHGDRSHPEEEKNSSSDHTPKNSITSIMHDVGIEIVSVPLDSNTLNDLRSFCAKEGMDVTTAFILFAKAASKGARLALPGKDELEDGSEHNKQLEGCEELESDEGKSTSADDE